MDSAVAPVAWRGGTMETAEVLRPVTPAVGGWAASAVPANAAGRG